MSFHVTRINKYIRWVRNERKTYKDNCGIDREYARLQRKVDCEILLHGIDCQQVDAASIEKHRWVLNYVANRCPETIAKYQLLADEGRWDSVPCQAPPRTWSMWWQGEDQADELFRMCIASARRHVDANLVVLSKDNYSDYFEIPSHMLEKLHEGKIALQHICDYIVVAIMAAEGGVFTGATVWWSQDVTDDVRNARYWSVRAVTNHSYHVSRSRWASYVMSGNKDFPLWAFARDALQEYWQNTDKAVDYLLIDYVFELAYEMIPSVREGIDALPKQNNILRNELVLRLSDPYDAEQFKRYTEGDTFLYKLSWKFGRKEKETEDGKPSNYGFMLKEAFVDDKSYSTMRKEHEHNKEMD